MAMIGTKLGILTDHEFEALARRDLSERHDELPAPDQLASLLDRYGVAAEHAEWAQSVALRALTKLVVGAPKPSGPAALPCAAGDERSLECA